MMEVMVLRAMMVMMAVMTVIMVTVVMWVGGGEDIIDVVAMGMLSVLVILFIITHCIPEPSSQH